MLCNSNKPYFKTEVTEEKYSIGKTSNSCMKILTCQYYLIKALLKNGFNMLPVNNIFCLLSLLLTSIFSRY